MSDTIANMLTSIRNAQAVKRASIKVPHSRINFEILKILKKEGWIKEAKVKNREKRNLIILDLKYMKDGKPVINGLRRVSKQGERVYIKHDVIPRVRQGYGSIILSTPLGIMTGKDAKKNKVGGEALCEIW